MRMKDIELLISNSWVSPQHPIRNKPQKLRNNLPIISSYKFYKTYEKQKTHTLLK